MPITNFSNGISSFGVPVMGQGVPASPGNYLFVDYGSGDDGRTARSNSADRPFKTIAKAYDLARTNKDDVIVLVGSATHALTEMLTVAKNRVHFVGLDGTARKFGQNAKISLGSTTVATDIATMLNTGVRNSFHNIKFVNNQDVATGIYCVIESGEYAVYSNFEIYKSTDLNETTASELVLNGDSAQFFNGTIGSLADLQVGNIIRPCVALNNGLAPSGTAQMRECYFEGVRMLKRSGGTASAFVWATADADVERTLEFRDCLFINAKLSTAVPAVAIGGTNAFTAGQILLTGNTAEVNCTALATQTGVWNAVNTYTAAGGSAIQST